MVAEIIEGMGSEDLVTERVARCPTTGNEDKINGETESKGSMQRRLRRKGEGRIR